jgi:hypothetical protein
MPGQLVREIGGCAVTPQRLAALKDPRTGHEWLGQGGIGRLERHHELVEQFRAERYTNEKFDELHLSAETALVADIEASRVRDLAAAITTVDAELVTARRGALDRVPELDDVKPTDTETERLRLEIGRLTRIADRGRRATQVATTVTLLQASDDAGELLESVEDALFSQDEYAIRTIGRVAERRLLALADKADRVNVRKPSPTFANPYREAQRKIETLLVAFRQEHPTPRQRVADLERRRQRVESDVNERYRKLLETLELDREGRVRRGMFRRPKTGALGAAF